MWAVSCVTVYNEDSTEKLGFELGKKKEMGCVTETPDYIIVSCQFYVIILDWMWNMFGRYFLITASDW